jgi:hypothetical protein
MHVLQHGAVLQQSPRGLFDVTRIPASSVASSPERAAWYVHVHFVCSQQSGQRGPLGMYYLPRRAGMVWSQQSLRGPVFTTHVHPACRAGMQWQPAVIKEGCLTNISHALPPGLWWVLQSSPPEGQFAGMAVISVCSQQSPKRAAWHVCILSPGQQSPELLGMYVHSAQSRYSVSTVTGEASLAVCGYLPSQQSIERAVWHVCITCP